LCDIRRQKDIFTFHELIRIWEQERLWIWEFEYNHPESIILNNSSTRTPTINILVPNFDVKLWSRGSTCLLQCLEHFERTEEFDWSRRNPRNGKSRRSMRSHLFVYDFNLRLQWEVIKSLLQVFSHNLHFLLQKKDFLWIERCPSILSWKICACEVFLDNDTTNSAESVALVCNSDSSHIVCSERISASEALPGLVTDYSTERYSRLDIRYGNNFSDITKILLHTILLDSPTFLKSNWYLPEILLGDCYLLQSI
jgi:hypothetical protein